MDQDKSWVPIRELINRKTAIVLFHDGEADRVRDSDVVNLSDNFWRSLKVKILGRISLRILSNYLIAEYRLNRDDAQRLAWKKDSLPGVIYELEDEQKKIITLITPEGWE